MTDQDSPSDSKPTRKAPAFQFYVDDFLAGTMDLSPEEVGAYIRLLCYQWNRGSIPVQTEKQQRLAGGSVSVDVLAKFRLLPDGRMVNERMERERQKQSAYRQMQAKKGVASGKSRKNEPKTNSGSTAVQPKHEPNTQPEPNSPSPSPSPNKEENKTVEEPPSPPVPPGPWHVLFGLDLPENLQTQNCLQAVQDWIAYKKERNSAYKPRGLKGALTSWSKQFTSATFPSAVERSIANNWAGLFPDNKPGMQMGLKIETKTMTAQEKFELYRQGLL